MEIAAVGVILGLLMARMTGPILFDVVAGWWDKRQRRKWREEHAEENRLWKEKMDKWDAEGFAAEADPANGMCFLFDEATGNI